MIEPLSLQEIKNIELNILRHFKTFCDENGLKYFLSNGTLLGAVKYQGIIPWDDDIDVLMPRADYDRLIREYVDSSSFELFAPERNGAYKFPFAKLCDVSTVKDEWNVDNGVELGLDIDIFPIDIWDDSYDEAENQMREIWEHIGKLNFVKYTASGSGNPVKTAIKKAILLFIKNSWKKHVSEIIRIATENKYNTNPVLAGCISWCMYREKEILPADVFDKTVMVQFEDDIYPAPAGYDKYLTSLYGDYRKDPPAEKQKTHHRFTAYRKKR